MNCDKVLKAISQKQILGYKRPQTVIKKVKDLIDAKKIKVKTTPHLIELNIKTVDGKLQVILSSYTTNDTYYIASYTKQLNKGG